MSEQPIESLLDEVRAHLKKWNDQYDGFPASWNEVDRLERELRQRLERFHLCEQVQKRGEHSSVTCACVEPALRQQLEQQQQSDVETALVELREMLPGYWIQINRSLRYEPAMYPDPFTKVTIVLDKVVDDFEGATLSEAMAAVKKWKEEGK